MIKLVIDKMYLKLNLMRESITVFSKYVEAKI